MNSKTTVIIADDSVEFLSLLAGQLEEDPRVQVIGRAGNGEELVALVQQLHPDVIVTDTVLAKLDGLAALRQIAALPEKCPLFIVTPSFTSPQILAEASALGHRVDAARVLEALRGELRPSMVAAVRRLRDAGLPLALLSNNVAPMERSGRLGELLELFDAVVESSVEGVRKPEPEIYRRALTRLSEAVGRPVAASDCAYLDDLGINLKPARAMGMHTVKVADPAAALAELSALVGLDLLDGVAS